MTKHPLPEKFEGYFANKLAPGELLEFDDHLAECETCRTRLSAPDRLKDLSDSFLGNFEAQPVSTQTESFKERVLDKFRYIGVYLISIRKTAGAVYLTSLAALIIIITGIFINFQNEPSAELTVQTTRGRENEPIVESKTVLTDAPKEFFSPKAGQGINSNSKNFAEAGNLHSKPAEKRMPVADVPDRLKKTDARKTWTIEEMITDESRMLSTNSDSGDSQGESYQLVFDQKNKLLNFRLNNARETDEFEFYLAEMPKISTLKRERRSVPVWSISERSLDKGRRYVLQVTIWRDGKPVDSLKKIIKSENKKLRQESKKQKRGKSQ